MNAHEPKPKLTKNEIEKGDITECKPFDSYVAGRDRSLLGVLELNERFSPDLNAELLAIISLNPKSADSLGKSFYIFKDMSTENGQRSKFMLIDKTGLISEDGNPPKVGLAGEFSAGETFILGRNSGTAQRLGGEIGIMTVSRDHVAILFTESGIEVTDLGSANGTNIQAFLDKVRLNSENYYRETLAKVRSGELQNPIPPKSQEEVLSEFVSD